jgi:hypothetical protein
MLIRKWLFIITFIVVLVGSLAFLFLRPEQYTVNSRIKISESYVYSNNKLYDYYPQDAEDLWIFATHRRDELEELKMEELVSELNSDEMIKRIAEDLGNSVPDIRGASRILLDEETIIISTTTNDAAETVRINKGTLDTFIAYKKAGFEENYNGFLMKLSDRIDSDYKDLQHLISEKGEKDAQYRLESWKPFEERDTGIIAAALSDIDSLNRRISDLDGDYGFLMGIKKNLEANKDFFINRIEIIQEPQSEGIILNISLRMNIVYSIVSAAVIAFIITFSVALFSYSKYTSMHSK